MRRKKTLRAIDICAGAGGWAVAARGLPIEITHAYDLQKDALDTYKYNHPDVRAIRGDVTTLDYSRMHGVDIFLGSIPCETVSTARLRSPKSAVSDADLLAWHAIIDSMLQGVEVARPRYWCFENVVQMRHHLPPLVPMWVGDAAKWSGQSRKRMYIGKFPVPQPSQSAATLSDFLRPGPYVIPGRVAHELIAMTQQGKAMAFTKNGGRWLNVTHKSPTICNCTKRLGDWCVDIDGRRRRVIQFAEAAALQGFPDDYVFVASTRRAWKMVAQAIPIPVGRAILESICADYFA